MYVFENLLFCRTVMKQFPQTGKQRINILQNAILLEQMSKDQGQSMISAIDINRMRKRSLILLCTPEISPLITFAPSNARKRHFIISISFAIMNFSIALVIVSALVEGRFIRPRYYSLNPGTPFIL